ASYIAQKRRDNDGINASARWMKSADWEEVVGDVFTTDRRRWPRRRDDADDALRSGPDHAGAFDEMVLAQGLGDEDRRASRDEEGDRGTGASVGRDHAPHLG